MAEAHLYVHVADDGGLLLIEGSDGRSSWVTEDDLACRVDAAVRAGGAVLLSKEVGSVLAMPVITALEAAGARVVAATEVHPDARRADGVTTLMTSAHDGAAHLVEDLIGRGADLDARDASGYTALMYAANGGHDGIVGALVNAGADVDARDRDGSTPLMFAAQQGNLRSVKRLLAARADATVRRVADGLTALDLAEMNGHDRVAAVLRSVTGR